MVQNVFRGAFAGLLDRCANGSVPASSQEFQDAQDAKASAAQAAEEVMQELSSQYFWPYGLFMIRFGFLCLVCDLFFVFHFSLQAAE